MVGRVLTSCLVRGEPDAEPVDADPKSLSGGVGGGLTNVGGFGVDFGPGGIYIGVSYGLGIGGAVRGVLTPHGFEYSSDDLMYLWLESLAYLVCVSTLDRLEGGLFFCTAHSDGKASRSASDNDGEEASMYGTCAMFPLSHGGKAFVLC